VGRDIFKLELLAPDATNKCKAGQFFHLKVANSGNDPLLRRPFSVFDVNYKNKSISLLYRMIGRGTEILSNYNMGDKLDVLGPLGNGFTLDKGNKNIHLVGGGMGIAPLYFLTKKLASRNNNNVKINVFLGTKRKNEMLYFTKLFSNVNMHTLKRATSDGSIGFKGNVVNMWKNMLSKNSLAGSNYVYTCGPEIMLKSIQKVIKKYNIKGECSLERRMGCGIGVCLSCICETKNGQQRTCKEGPVFSLSEVVFDE
jgi:dihydroorotate dehydrogenase electron transfer subunit